MEENNELKKPHNDHLQHILDNLSKCKKKILSEGEECNNLREINTKLMTELKDSRELEKCHRYQLTTSREMIANLQETVSQLVYLKRDVKRLKEELVSKDSIIDALEKEKENVIRKHNEMLTELRSAHDKEIQDLTQNNDRRVQQIQIDLDTEIAQMTCVAEELRCRISEMEKEHREKTNEVVLQYEEKLQHQEQRQLLKLEMLEEKVKQSQFKEYLAQSSYPLQGESSSSNATYDSAKQLKAADQNGAFEPLRVTYSEAKPHEKRGKKRKLFNDKDFLKQ